MIGNNKLQYDAYAAERGYKAQQKKRKLILVGILGTGSGVYDLLNNI